MSDDRVTRSIIPNWPNDFFLHRIISMERVTLGSLFVPYEGAKPTDRRSVIGRTQHQTFLYTSYFRTLDESMKDFECRGIDVEKIVSPVHCWFFWCTKKPLRPIILRKLDDFVLHQIVSMEKVTLGSLFAPLEWVRPTDAGVSRMRSPPKWDDLAYLVFPDFGHWLSKYIHQQDHIGTIFVDFYGAQPWQTWMDKNDCRSLTDSKKDLYLRSCWRWEDTSEMLWGRKEKVRNTKDRNGWAKIPPGWSDWKADKRASRTSPTPRRYGRRAGRSRVDCWGAGMVKGSCVLGG